MKGLKITPKSLIYFMIYYYFGATFLIGFMGITTAIYYLTDMVNIVLIVFLSRRIKGVLQSKFLRFVNLTLAILIIVLILSIYINEVPFLLMVMGIRNMFRFFVVFFASIIYLDLNDIDHLMDFFLKIQIINFLIGLYKYFVLGLWSDAFGGGFFRNGSGLNPFCLMLICYYTSKFLYKKEKWTKYLFVLFSVLLLAMFAEEKSMMLVCCICVVTIYFIISIYDFTINSRRVWGVVTLCAIAIAVMFVGRTVAPEMLHILSSFDSILEVGKVSFEEGYRIPRIGAFKMIDDLFFETQFTKLFGLGLGNCDTSGFVQSSFYKIYGEYNYRWFTHQWTYLECGKIGFVCFVNFFVAIAGSLLVHIKKISKEARMLGIASAVYAISTIILMWHSASIKTDSGVFAFFMLAVGFIALRQEYEKGKN